MQPTLFTCNDVSATGKLILDGGQGHPSAKDKTALQQQVLGHKAQYQSRMAQRQWRKRATAFVVLKTSRVILGKRLKSHFQLGLNSSLIFKGMLVPNKELVGFLASLGLQIPWPEEASIPIMLLNHPRAPQSDCSLDQHTLGINLHYIFMDEIIWSYFKKKKKEGVGVMTSLPQCQWSRSNY